MPKKQPKPKSQAEQTVVVCPKAQAILYPKRSGLTGTDKPQVVHVSSPWDEDSSATSYSASTDVLSGAGFGVLNKKKIEWTTTDPEEIEKSVKPVKMNGKPLTIWIDAHGAPGWFFGAARSAKDEFQKTVDFLKFISAIEAQTGGKVANVVLSGCFTANEIVNSTTKKFFCSPARMLSFLLPDVNVLGFVGQNASAKVTHLFEKSGSTYNPVTVSPHEAAVIYKNGKVEERYTRDLHCNYKYMGFACGLIDIDVPSGERETTYYAPTNAPEVAKATFGKDLKGKSYGEVQLAVALKTAEELRAPVVEEVEDEDAAPSPK